MGLKSFFLGIFCCSLGAMAQVGINTAEPKAQLDIAVPDQSSPGITDGILIPRIKAFPVAQPTIDQNGMLVFLEEETSGFSTGFYYWNDRDKIWVPLLDNAFSNFYKMGTELPSRNIGEGIYRYGNISIGGDEAPDAVKLKVLLGPEEEHSIRTALEIENASSAAVNVTYSLLSNNKSSTADRKYGIKNTVSADGKGVHYGIFNETYQKSVEEMYGIFNRVGRTYGATKNHYGIFSEIGTPLGNGMVYGIYSSAFGEDPEKVYAGYFAGRVGIGALPENQYIFPDSKGKTSQVLASGATGELDWVYPGRYDYSTTATATGTFVIEDQVHTLGINNGISSITIPDALLNKGRILVLLGWPGITFKPFNFLNGNSILDVTTNSLVTGIGGMERLIIQSTGSRWVVLGR